MAWYKTGTISVTNGSTTVTGSGTSWVAGAGIGEALIAPDGKIYEIANIASNTSLTLASNYLGTTLSAQSYTIVPTQSYIRDLAADAASLISQYAGIASGAGAGLFGDGLQATPGIAFASDVDTGIRRTTTNTMALVTAGVDRMTINGSGISAIDINGGTIDGATVGSTTPSTGSFTTLSSTGNTTLGDASTDTVTVNGYMGVGGAVASNTGIFERHSALTGVNQYGVGAYPISTSAATTKIVGFGSGQTTAAAAFTVVDSIGFEAATTTKGAGSTITNQHGLYVADQTQGTNNYGITSLVSSGANKWNIYASGTAANYFAGNVGIGTFTPQSVLDLGSGSSGERQISWHTNSITSYGNIWTSRNGGKTIIAGGLKGSTTVNNGFESSVSATWGRTAIEQDYGVIKFYTDPASTVAYGTAITPTERLRIDSAGNVLVGTTVSTTISSVAAQFQIRGATAATSYSSISRTSADANAAAISFGKERAGAIVVSGDTTGSVLFAGFDGANYLTGASIFAAVDGTPGTNNMPGRLVFSTTADGASTPTERLRIDSAGNLGLGVTPSAWGSGFTVLDVSANGLYGNGLTRNAYYNGTNWIYKTTAAATLYTNVGGIHVWSTAPSGTAGTTVTFTQSLAVGKGTTLALEGATSAAGTGIAFPATQLASSNANTLDDYRELTFTATATGMTTSPTGTATVVRVGNDVTIAIPTITGTSNATTFTLTGMPTTCRPSATRTILVRVQDNTGTIVFGIGQIDTAGVITLFKDAAGGAFTASGTKSVNVLSASYII